MAHCCTSWAALASWCDLVRGNRVARQEKPDLGSSPLLWGALITMTAPAGRRRNPDSVSIP